MDTKTGGKHNESNEHELSDLGGNVFSDNPIIAAIESCLFERGQIHLTALEKHKYHSDEMRAFIVRVFNNKAFREIGVLVIEALLTGDADFAVTVKEAVKEADSLFHRDREKELLDSFATFVWSFGENIPPKRELLRLFAEKNNGKTLTAQRWRRLRKALNLPEGKIGRPRNPDT